MNTKTMLVLVASAFVVGCDSSPAKPTPRVRPSSARRCRWFALVATGIIVAQAFDADSPANAKVKAELQGIIVTSLERCD